ncbi:hypothetical protein K1T71_008276 [Dendrolimus kikuchii]|uniref:Uncharacterized protein n=1 Tax=Dendrolimus kikuchii TaxID=765133 RepID=A0ACC1CWX1_9NEOP|nr:hypothetical protein K1T71_008276 [Dendrolimus kikuchii]
MPFSVKDRKSTIALLKEDLPTCSEKEKEKKLHSIQMLYALEKFHEKCYSHAMSEFLRLNADPVEVIKLFPQIRRYTGKKWQFLNEKQDTLPYLIWYLEKLQIKLNGEISKTTDNTDTEIQSIARDRLAVVNTTLLKWYLMTNSDALSSHIQKNDYWHDFAENLLRRHEKHHELLTLYKKKGLHVKALQYLKTKAKEKKTQPSCYRFDEMKNYLQHLGAEHIALIIQFTDFIIKENPYQGLEMFTDGIINAENLPRRKILDYLVSENKLLATLYLEHVIHKWKDIDLVFHETLINLYIEQINAKQTETEKRDRDELHYRLLIFLEKSENYDVERILMNMPKEGFLEERAILYGKLGKYEDGLIIYVSLMENLDKAIQYCEKMYDAKDLKARNIYLKLIQFLLKKLKEGDTKIADLDSILDILENNANKISAIDVLPELPDSAPLHRLQHFLNCTLESQFAMKQAMQIYKSLSYVEASQMPEQVRKAEAKSFEVTIKMTCPVCKKPFGNQKKQAPFVRYPDGQLVHIMCKPQKVQNHESITSSS